MNQIITAAAGENNLPAAKRAVQITERIRANGRTAVNAVCAIGEDLRTMKIDNLYTELGYETFEDYAEKEFDLKRRQAYQYISVYEKLGKEFVQSNAQLGITKLALLATVNPEDRAEIMESEDVAGITTRELEELLSKQKEQGEQLTLLQEEKNELEAKLEELESAPKDVTVATKEIIKEVPDTKTEKKLREAESELEKMKKELSTVQAEADLYKKSAETARKDSKKEAEQAAAKKLEKLQQELLAAQAQAESVKKNLEKMKEQAEQDKKKLEEKLSELQEAAAKPAENPDKSNFKAMLANTYKEITGLVEFIKNSEPEERSTFKTKAALILNAGMEALKQIEASEEVKQQPRKGSGIVDISKMEPSKQEDEENE